MSEPRPTYKDNLFHQIRTFRDLMGTKTFWALPKVNRDGAVKALSLAYFGMGADPDDFIKSGTDDYEVELCASLFHTTLEEYHMRGRMLRIETH